MARKKTCPFHPKLCWRACGQEAWGQGPRPSGARDAKQKPKTEATLAASLPWRAGDRSLESRVGDRVRTGEHKG